MKNLIPMCAKMQSMLKEEKGATMVEYALMVALIAVVCLVAVTGVGTAANGQFTAIAAAL